MCIVCNFANIFKICTRALTEYLKKISTEVYLNSHLLFGEESDTSRMKTETVEEINGSLIDSLPNVNVRKM